MSTRAWVRRAGRPVVSARRLVGRVAEGPGLPVGCTARTRRVLRAVLGSPSRALVVGPAGVVRQALPQASLDVVGTDPHRPEVTVVSAADGVGSLPRRWECVVVTDPTPTPGRLLAVVEACLSGGALAVVRRAGSRPVDLPGTRLERTLRRGCVEIDLARVTR